MSGKDSTGGRRVLNYSRAGCQRVLATRSRWVWLKLSTIWRNFGFLRRKFRLCSPLGFLQVRRSDFGLYSPQPALLAMFGRLGLPWLLGSTELLMFWLL